MELDDKKQFIKESFPFSELDDAGINFALNHLQITYEKAGVTIDSSALNNAYFLLRSGCGEAKNANNEFVDRLSAGDGFGANNFNLDRTDSASPWHHFIFLEDALLYRFPQSTLDELAQQNAKFAACFTSEKARGLHHALYEPNQDYRLNQSVAELMVSPPLCTHDSATIIETAKTMSEARVSSILIVKDGNLNGIVTDRDLRSRVLAEELDPGQAVSSVMSQATHTIHADQTVYSAQLKMMQANIHHLPVVEQHENALRPVGIISLNDLIRAQNSEPIFMIQAINRAKNRESLYRISQQLPDLICKMIRANVRANEIGKIITSITDNITHQLIFLAQQSFGPAPCNFAWVVFGSQARQDQMLGSDQDNGLILSNEASPEDRAYFARFAHFVNEGLDKSGLRYCPGDIMAQNEKWCQPLSTWQQYFRTWIREPDPKALMHASIFYDVRHVAGGSELTASLLKLILEEAEKNTIFQACMSENVLQSSPPLGFFKTFVLEKDGNHNPVLDLKHRGTVPIVALARLYCLANKLSEVNTEDRLQALEEHKILSPSEARNLIDAHNFIATLRLENQNEAIQSGHDVSNNLNPDDLSPLVRRQLKDAFSVVAESQRLLKMRFGHGAI